MGSSPLPHPGERECHARGEHGLNGVEAVIRQLIRIDRGVPA